MTSKLKHPFRQGYEKPLHYPCTIMVKAKPTCSYDKRLYCDIFSTYLGRERDWDISSLKDNAEWWCFATDLERYIKQLNKDLKIATKALEEIIQDESDEWYYIAKHALEQIKQKEETDETSKNQNT